MGNRAGKHGQGGKDSGAALSGPVLSLGVGLLKQVPPQPCLVLSPVSIYTAAALALNGAGSGSGTHQQLLSLLLGAGTTSGGGGGSSPGQEGDVNAQLSAGLAALRSVAGSKPQEGAGAGQQGLVVAHSVWAGQAPLRPEYAKAVGELFGAVAKTGTAADVNAWAESATGGRVRQLMEPSAPFDAALASAIHFRGLWVQSFDKRMTRDQPFYMGSQPGAGSVTAAMMTAVFEKKTAIKVVTCPGRFQAAALPYQGGAFFALALLPEEGQGPLEALQALADEGLPKEERAPAKTTVHLPRFKAEASLSLGPALQALGVADAFSAAQANFSRLTEQHAGLHITQVAHKAVLEVDEEGTVAAAATVVAMNRSLPVGPPKDEVTLTFDRPFAWLVMWQPAGQGGGATVPSCSGVPLFVATVVDPTGGSPAA